MSSGCYYEMGVAVMINYYSCKQKLYDRVCLVNWISDATTHCANQLLSTSYR